MADWYENGLMQLKEEVASSTGVDLDSVEKVYSWLFGQGYIDYDIEKEIIFDTYGDEAEDEA